ncbi:uracil-DNA glycosylase [Paramaledivibacter caminithermalis]|uniref:Type-4 uracil-DNA glycosylase n=1 Tax=Paramaledivibacter caminithermalis (strain DSM 15212 / CIP 107654 / DViRD3) TaxID=1121301 RepID=A0A1M6P9Z0_PARC5|nr:uracil-DNA glycosylase [Paramaledivibacter caminithermalis]SHK04738.1 DNA polymerase [Paramaledivibacter caminithermalis DSM 15212]
MYTLDELKKITNQCRRCRLCMGRTNVVFGQGNPKADIMFIGEGPGQQEDLQGQAFVGAAGQLLTKAIEAIDFKREEVFIANIVKCRPPNNRNPKEDEIKACISYLRWQVKLIKPKMIICLGSVAAKNIIDKNLKITRQRGQWIEKKGFMILPTFHPAALLRDESKKRPFWEDFKKVKRMYDELNKK